MKLSVNKRKYPGWQFGVKILPASKVGRYGWFLEIEFMKYDLQIRGNKNG